MRRRRLLATTGTILTAGCLTRTDSTNTSTEKPTSEYTVPEGTWPQIGYDAGNTRYTPDAPGPREDAEIAWTSLGDRPVYPPVVGDDLYLTEAWTAGTALAVATGDGSERWEQSDLPPMRWAPALHGNRLLVLTRERGNVVRLHALDTESGEQDWVRQEGITASSGKRPPVGPTVRDGTVYIASNRGVIACEAATGSVTWRATLGEHVVETLTGPTWRTDWATPAVTADRVFTFDTNDDYGPIRTVYAVDRATGEQAWTAELSVGNGWSLQGHVVAGDDHVFVSALDPHVSAGFEDSPWSGTERLFALDVETGAVDWDWELSGKTLTPPAYADRGLYVGEWYPDADTGRLHALNASNGQVQWTHETETGAVLSPTVAGDTVYVNQGEQVAAIARSDGHRRWRLSVGARTSAPVVVDDSLYVTTNPGRGDDSRLLAIRSP